MVELVPYTDQDLAYMPTGGDLKTWATNHLETCKSKVYKTLAKPQRPGLDSSFLTTVRSVIKTACEFPHLIEDAFQLLSDIEKHYSVTSRRTEWAKVYALLATTAINHMQDARSRERVLRMLLWRIGTVQFSQFRFEDAVSLLEYAVDAGLDNESYDWILAQLAHLHVTLTERDAETNIEKCDELLLMARQLGNRATMELSEKQQFLREQREAEMQVFLTKTFIHSYFGQSYQSFVTAQYAFALARRLNDVGAMLAAAGGMMTHYNALEPNSELATRVIAYCETLEITSHGYLAQNTFYINAAAQKYCAGDHQGAVTYYQKALVMSTELGNVWHLATVHHGYGQTLMKLLDFERAEHHLSIAQNLYHETGNEHYTIDVEWVRAWCWYLQGNISAAIEGLVSVRRQYQALDIDETIKQRRIETLAQDIAKLHNALGTEEPSDA